MRLTSHGRAVMCPCTSSSQTKYFGRPGLYHDEAFNDYADNPRRFAFRPGRAFNCAAMWISWRILSTATTGTQRWHRLI